jgi:general secretion pathway protein N
MTMHLNLWRVGLTSVLAVAAAHVVLAATPTGVDRPAGSMAAPPIEIITTDKPRAAPVPPSGNPLWALPLSLLSATRERPIFLPSRRPPAPIVAAPRPALASAPPPPPAAPARPPLALVGAVIGESEAIAIFIDQGTRNVLRLKTGQDHDGWVLNSVKSREATLQKDKQTAVFALPVPNAPPGPGNAPVPASAPMDATAAIPVVPSGGEAPFIPRSVPKNGESDGL